MRGVPSREKGGSVLEERLEGAEPVPDAPGASRQVHNQAHAPKPHLSPGEDRCGSGRGARPPERLGKPYGRAIENRSRGLGGHVPRRESRASAREEEVHLSRVGPLEEDRNDRGRPVGDHGGARYRVPSALAPLPDAGPAPVLRLPSGDPITHGQDPDADPILRSAAHFRREPRV